MWVLKTKEELWNDQKKDRSWKIISRTLKLIVWLISGNFSLESKEYICIQCGKEFLPSKPTDYFRKIKCDCGNPFYEKCKLKWVEA